LHIIVTSYTKILLAPPHNRLPDRLQAMIMAMYQLGAASDEICAELVSDLQSWIQHLLKYRVKCGKKKLINEKQIAVES